jgi:hypothetical protein
MLTRCHGFIDAALSHAPGGQHGAHVKLQARIVNAGHPNPKFLV